MASIDHASIEVTRRRPTAASPPEGAVGEAGETRRSGAAARSRRVPIRIRVAQAILVLTGAATMAGATYFGLVNPDENYAWRLTALFAPTGFALGAGRVFAAVRLHDGSRAARRLAAGVVAAGIGYTLLKLVLFGETEALTFGVTDLVVLVLVATGAPLSRAGRRSR